MKRVVFYLLLTIVCPASLSAGQGTGAPFQKLNGDVECYEEEISVTWHISLSTGNRRLLANKKQSVPLSRITSISTHCFDMEGNETERCIFRPRNANVATIELNADGLEPVVVNDSIDMTLPSERMSYSYNDDGRVVVSRWTSISGMEHFEGTDTIIPRDTPFLIPHTYIEQDSLGTRSFHFNDHGCLSVIKNDMSDGTMTITVYDNYRYDRYDNWTERKRYSIRPDGNRVLSGIERRSYRYR